MNKNGAFMETDSEYKERVFKLLIDDLFWEYERLTSSGKETLDELGDLLGLEKYENSI